MLNVMFLISPKVAYNFSELIEMHAGELIDLLSMSFFVQLSFVKLLHLLVVDLLIKHYA